jgi:3',5'-cyclic AMP phosphodiesterase CpdA
MSIVSAVPAPVYLAQLSDCHIGAAWGGEDPEARLARVVAAATELRPPVTAVLLSGDLANDASDEQYARLRELLAPLRAPVHVLPGNHDDRDALRRHFGAPGDGGNPIQYAVDLGALRLVALDTLRPGHDGGRLGPERLEWLDGELGSGSHTPTLLALHHPPVITGLPAFDAIGLDESDRRGLAQIVARHPQVHALTAGHVHRAFVGELAGRPVLSVPSTYLQARLDFRSPELAFGGDPPGFAVHAVLDGGLVSHFVFV